ncbi:MAG: hypothetical protein AMXMBFR84_40980 [Candidatus Hydrogenedentota bacterium]
MSSPVVFAVAAHPDDIELMMGGTFALLGRAGCELHYMNLCNGSMGTDKATREAIIGQRTAESWQAASVFGAHFHDPVVDDLGLMYDVATVRRVGAVMREVNPSILLLQSPQDYMEDHTNAARLAATAAFCRGMRNFITEPPVQPVVGEMAVYHALPWGLRDPLRRVLRAGLYVNVESVRDVKRNALACHKSQKEWLDVSQGLDSYLTTMDDMSRKVGRMSGRFAFAEGWRRHLHLGYGGEDFDPLYDALKDIAWIDPEYEADLNGPLAPN